MKTLFRLPLWLVLGAVLVVPAGAAFESVKSDPENVLPRFPLSLQAQGITRGEVVVAVSIGADGTLKDSLVLAYTHALLARATTDALKDWRFRPARLNGVPVPTQLELTLKYTVEGVVITSNVINHFYFDNFDHLGDGSYAYRMHSPRELDRVPVPVSTPLPKYALQAEKEGVCGRVEVRFYIDEQGTVRLPSIMSPAVPSYLAEKAVEAVRRWKFEPPTSHGEPVLVAASQEFTFGPGR